MTVNSKIFSISTLNTIEHGPLTLNIKPHLDPPIRRKISPLERESNSSYFWISRMIKLDKTRYQSPLPDWIAQWVERLEP